MKQSEFESGNSWRGQHKPGIMPKIESDEEVRFFVETELQHHGYEWIAIHAKKRFGERAPSTSSISRYWRKHRLRLLREWKQQPNR